MAKRRKGRKGLRIGQSKITVRKIRRKRRLTIVKRVGKKKYRLKFVSKKYHKGRRGGKWYRTSRTSKARDFAIEAKHMRKAGQPTYIGDLKGSRI